MTSTSFIALALPSLPPESWALAVTAAVLVGFSKTGVAGLGIVAIPLMAMVFPARESTGVLLPMLIVGDFIAAGYFRRHALRREMWMTLARLLPWVIGGLVVGRFALKVVTNEQMAPILGGLILGLVVLQLVRRRCGDWMEHKLPHTWWFAAGMGFLAGVATMLANAAGPVTVMYFLARKLPKAEFMGTGAWFYLVVNLSKLPLSAGLGLITVTSLTFDLLMVPIILAGAAFGILVLSRLPQKVFDTAVLVVAVLASVKLIAQWP
jgi:uncharacterized membrane protein YfcA